MVTDDLGEILLDDFFSLLERDSAGTERVVFACGVRVAASYHCGIVFTIVDPKCCCRAIENLSGRRGLRPLARSAGERFGQ